MTKFQRKTILDIIQNSKKIILAMDNLCSKGELKKYGIAEKNLFILLNILIDLIKECK